MSPAGGVGANTALDDAARLAGHLARAVQDGDLPAALAAYETDMRARANAAVAASSQGRASWPAPSPEAAAPARPVERARRKGYPAPEPHPPAGLAPLPRKPPRPHGKPASIDETPARTDQPRRIRPAAGVILGRRGENSLRGATAVRTLRRRAAPPAGHHPLRPWARSPTAQAACSSMAAGCACWDRDTPAHARHRRLERRPLERLPADRRRCRHGGFSPSMAAAWRGRGCPVLLGARHPGMGTAGTELYRLPALGAGRRTGGVLRRAALARLAGRYAGPGGDQGFSFIRSCGRAKARRRPARARRWIWRSCMP